MFAERVYFQKMQMQAAAQAEPGGVPKILQTSNQGSAMAIRMTGDRSSKMEVGISLQIDLRSHKENAPLLQWDGWTTISLCMLSIL
jgi:hypothetical protein